MEEEAKSEEKTSEKKKKLKGNLKKPDQTVKDLFRDLCKFLKDLAKEHGLKNLSYKPENYLPPRRQIACEVAGDLNLNSGSRKVIAAIALLLFPTMGLLKAGVYLPEVARSGKEFSVGFRQIRDKGSIQDLIHFSQDPIGSKILSAYKNSERFKKFRREMKAESVNYFKWIRK